MKQYKTFSTMGKDENAPDTSTMGEVPVVTGEQHRRHVIERHNLVVVYNYTDWCGPCQQCGPQFAVLAGKYSRPGVCSLIKENIEKKYGGLPVQVRGVPCFHFYMNGQFLKDEVIIGADMGAIEQTIRKLLNVQ